MEMMIKHVKLVELNIRIGTEYANFKDYLIAYKCLCCNKITNTIDEKLKERFFNTYKFYNHDNNNFIFLLREGVYLNKYMDVCEKLN